MNDKDLNAAIEEEISETQINTDSQLNKTDDNTSVKNDAPKETGVSIVFQVEKDGDAEDESRYISSDEESGDNGESTEIEAESQDPPSLFPSVTADAEEAAEESTDAISEDYEQIDESDRIVPPDELFAYMEKEEKAEVEEVGEELDLEESPSEDDDTDDNDDDENVDVDGQYHFSELELAKEYHKKNDYEESKQAKYDPKKPRRIDSLFDFVELFVFTLIAVMLLTSFVFKHSIVSGSSMENTLDNGDHLIITDFFYTPERGDIVVCDYREHTIKYPVVKRVIGIPGDVVEVKIVNSKYVVYVNGRQLDEPYVKIDLSGEFTAQAPITIPEGMYFVMGDNRNKSADSRNPMSLGLVPEESVLGKVLLRIYPFDKFGTIEQGIKYVE